MANPGSTTQRSRDETRDELSRAPAALPPQAELGNVLGARDSHAQWRRPHTTVLRDRCCPQVPAAPPARGCADGRVHPPGVRAVTVTVELPEDLVARIAAIVHDIDTTAGVDFILRIEDRAGLGPMPWLWSEDGSGTSLVLEWGDGRAFDTAEIAEQMQEAVIEARWQTGQNPVVWPECPFHMTHPLDAVMENDEALWICPTENTVRCAIGSLPMPSPTLEAASYLASSAVTFAVIVTAFRTTSA